MSVTIFSLIVPIALTGLMLGPQATQRPWPASAPAVDEIIFKGFPFPRDIMRVGLEKALGRPASVSEKELNGRRSSRLQFTGLAVELFAEPIGTRGTVSSIELSDNRWRFPAKLHIGSTRAEMIKLLGSPDIDRSAEAIYGCYDCVWDDKIHFVFEGDRIKSMNWDFYVN